MKKFIITSLAVIGIALSAHANDNLKLIVDNKIIDTAPISVNDRTLVPIRALMESTGAEVNWDGDTFGIDITKGNESVHLAIGNSVMTSSAGDIELDVAPILYNDTTTYVPLRAVCEAFSFDVDWDELTETILISAPDGCPYVDVYGGLTVADYLSASAQTVEDFEEDTGMVYNEVKDTLFTVFSNSLPLTYVSKSNNMTLSDLKSYLSLPDNTPDDTTWGAALGEMTLKDYITINIGEECTDEIFDSFKSYYKLGDEYTGETKYKYVRTIIDTADLTTYDSSTDTTASALPSAEDQAIYDAILPSLCENKRYFTITLEDGSQMSGELYPDLAKNTVENFIKLCDEGFYDGLIFHRVIDGFMIQGGGYDKDLTPKYADTIIGEFYSNNYVNPLKHERGVISMARADGLNTASSQFFIMDGDASYLDGYYAAFGRITDGFDVLDKISETQTGTSENGMMTDVPTTPIVIKSITVE